MKIIMFCIMTYMDGSTVIYKYQDQFDTRFACTSQARIEAKNVSFDERLTNINFVCDTKENLHNYL